MGEYIVKSSTLNSNTMILLALPVWVFFLIGQCTAISAQSPLIGFEYDPSEMPFQENQELALPHDMQVFLTGATGYIGGDLLAAVTTKFPTASITALVRDVARAQPIADKYSNVQLLKGDLDSNDLIEEAVSRSDVIINAASNKHLGAIHSIANGIRRSEKKVPPVFLQISGASLFAVPDIDAKSFGEPSEHAYNDYDGASEITSLIQKTASRAADQAILAIANELSSKVRLAVIFPPIIYGEGRGLVNTRSVQIPDLCKLAIQGEGAVYVGKGEARWGNIHIADLSDLMVKLVERAVSGDVSQDLWNQNGLYSAQSGEITWKAIAQAISEAARESNINATVKSMSAEETDKVFAYGSILFGTNARAVSKRAETVLGWKPSRHSLESEIPLTFKRESTTG